MKKLIKKVVALAAGASMVGATIMGAMAAYDLSSYPEPFIMDGAFDAIMVVGDTAAPADIIGVTDIAMSLQYASKTTTSTTGGSAQTVSASGEAYKVETSTDKLNLGNKLTTIQTTPIDDGDLPTLLADGTYRNDEGSDYAYEQQIVLNDTATHKLDFFADTDYNDKYPTLGVKFVRNLPILQYQLKFTKSAESDLISTATTLEDFEDTDITILGKEYNIVDAANSSTKLTLELMGGALKDTLEEGQTKTYTLDGKEYEVENVIVTDTGTLYTQFKVNGETTKKMQEGQTDKMSDGTQVGIRTILQNEAGDVTQDMVEFYLGAEKMTIEDSTPCTTAPAFVDNVELNDEDVDDLYADLAFDDCGTKSKLNKITLTWKPDDDTFITEENSETMPGLGAVKLSFEGFVTPKEEVIEIENSGSDQIVLNVPIEGAESSVAIDLLYSNTTAFTRVGGSGTDEVLSTLTSCATGYTYVKATNQYFLASDSTAKESHLVEITKVNTDSGVNVTTFRDLATGNKYEDKKNGDSFTIGDVTLTVGSISPATETVSVTVAGGSPVCNKLYTPEGLTVYMPVDSTTIAAANGIINTTAKPTTFSIVFTEEDKDENLGSGASFIIPVSISSAKVAVASVTNITSYEIEDTDLYIGYVTSDLATKLELDTSPDQDTAKLIYHGAQSYGNFYVSSTGTTFKKTGTAGTSTATEVVKIEVGAAKLASKIVGREKSENLIIVGGPCVNTAAQAIMGTGADCTEGFTPGKAMIKVYENNGNVALVVAGYAAQDTTAAAQVVANFDDPAYADDFKGTELEVTDTSSSKPTIGAPTVMEAE